MSIKNLNREQILEGLSRYEPRVEHRIRTLYVNDFIDEKDFDRAYKLYSNLKGTHYDTVIFVERFPGEHKNQLPMISNIEYETPIGNVPANDTLRNEFCDEEDDFFIDDEGFSDKMSMTDHLMMLQCIMEDFTALSVQIASYRTSIIRELSYAMTELLRERNALMVFCSDISNSKYDDLIQMEQMVKDNAHTRLLNYLNTGDAGMLGHNAFMSGILVSETLELKNSFLPFEKEDSFFLAGYGCLTNYKVR